jgi:DNA-binding NarL/FixJ family response regulator
MSIKVVIVEDNHELREGLSQLVNGTPGYKCVGAFANCDSLLERIGRSMPDVVLMDIGLPGTSGIEGVKMVKSRFPQIELLMLTVYEDERKIFDSICAGASGYLLKKTPPAKILEAIREIHNGGAPMTAKVARKVLDMFQQNAPAANTEYQLSEREREVLAALVKGLSYKMIAGQCYISVDTVRSHIKNIYEKLHVHSKSEAVVKALRSKLV